MGNPVARLSPREESGKVTPYPYLPLYWLIYLLKHLEKQNKIKGVIMKDINLTHLLFTDDILLFVQDDDESIRNLQFTIHLFESATGLNINLAKTSISPINVARKEPARWSEVGA